MIDIIEKLLALQKLELKLDPLTVRDETEIARLRSQVPPPIIDHFDRLIAHGKKGVALVRHGVCCECHLRICSGTVAALAHPSDIHVCDNCGRYLHLAPEPAEEPPLPPKKRRRKTTDTAVAV